MKNSTFNNSIVLIVFLFISIVSNAQTPTAPTADVIYDCSGSSSEAILTRIDPVPTGETWYWQSSATGTSTSSSKSGVTYTRTYGSVYYLRAKNNTSGLWSTATAVTYHIKSTPDTPYSFYVTETNNDGNTVLTTGQSLSTGQEYYWQATSDGTSTVDSGNSITLYDGSVYYLRIKDTDTDCWSDSSTINYTVIPALPIILPVVYICGGSYNTATLEMGTPPANITYYWQDYSFQTSTSNSSPTVLRTSGNSYYIRAKNTVTGEWSSALQVNYFIKSKPSTPSNPSVVNNPTSVTITRANPPSNVTWYWQPDPNDMFMDDSSPTKTLVNSSVHYLRARDNDTGCWSDAREIHYALNPTELSLSVDYTCGSSTNTATLTREPAPTGVTWYWQSSATNTGTSSSKAAATFVRTSGSVYYIRARNNITGDWSGATAVNYHIKNKPVAPSSSNISIVKNDGETILSTSQTPPSDQAYYWQTTSDGTTTTNSGNSPITVTDGTTHYLRALDTDTECWGDARAISYTVKPNVPVILLPVTYNCTGSSNTATLTRDIPPTGVTWYWQSSTTGTSITSSKSAVTYLLTSGSTYYLRAKNDANSEWSSAVQVAYVINAKPATPSSSNITINKVEGSTTLSTTQTPPSGQIYYWQATSDGISITSLGNTPTILTSGTVSYLRAQDDVTKCWGTAREINYSVIPSAPLAQSITITNVCRDPNDYLIEFLGINTVTLTNTITPPTGITYYWQSNASSTSTSESDQTITLNSGDEYFIRARNSAGDWSTATQIEYVIKPELATPSTYHSSVTETNNIDNTVLSTTQTPPSGQTFYWQSTVDGVDETKPSTSPQTLTSGIVYYLRSQDNDLGCWGKTGTINYTITPGVPTIASTINNCGETILTRDTPTNNEVVWYWQNAVDGVDELNSDLSITYTSGTETYLRAYNTVSDIWSNALTINYTVNEQPVKPKNPNITYNDGVTILSKKSGVPTGIVWYWQSSPTGIVIDGTTSNPTISLTSGTEYYLRAHNGTSDCWSEARVINYSVELDPLPPTIASVVPGCGISTLTRNSPTASNETWYWQSSPTNTNTTNDNSTINKTSGSSTYLRAFNSVSNKWSVATPVNYVIGTLPNIPTIVSKTHTNGMATVTRGTPPTGIVWYWQSSYLGTITTNSSLTRTVSEGSLLYLRAFNSTTGCWSTYLSINTYQNDIPDTPTLADVTITTNCNLTILTKVASPSGILWRWEDTPEGTVGNTNSHYAYSGTEIYLRAHNVASGQYSVALTVPYTIYKPEVPDAPIITMNAGSTTLTKTGTPPTDVVWYWQATALSTDTSATAAENTVTHTSGTQYFLRGYNSNLDCWGDTRTIDYVVSQTPIITPIAANISSTEDCGSTTLTKIGAPPTGLSWYWQTIATGEVIDANASNNTVTFNTGSGTHYLRAREDIAPNTWSSALAIDYIVHQTPNSPTLSDVSIINSPGTTSISITGTPSENVQWYWQSTATGTDTSDASTSKNLTSGTFIYLRAKNTQVTGCWSTPLLINYTIDPVPVPVPLVGAITITNNNDATTLSYDLSTVPTGITWYWQSITTGVITDAAAANNTVIRTTDTKYYLRAKDDTTNEWSEALEITYTVLTYSLWYADTDGDGFGDTAVSTSSYSQPENYVSNADDIDDSNVNITNITPQNYYLDQDGDGFGDPSDLELFSTKPAGRVLNNTDACPTVFGINNGCDAYTPATLSSDQNYVYTRMYQEPMTTDAGITKFDEIIESITYFDGLGRPVQSIGINQSPLGKDIITHIGYDNFGRQDKDWLPYQESTGNRGSYRGDVSLETQQYYKANYTADYVDAANTSEVNAFSQKNFEASPLNRVLKQAAPGNTWQLLSNSDSDHTTKYEYGINALNEVYKFDIVENNISSPFEISFYTNNQLIKNTVKNENWSTFDLKLNTKDIFTDKSGRKIAEFNYELEGSTVKKLSTYYVYDTVGNLRYVLPPKMVSDDINLIIDPDLNAPLQNLVTQENLDNLTFQYKYDEYNRQIEQKVPGKEWEYMVYDLLDRPVLTQDANLKAQNKWLFNKYDVFGRVVYTGIYNSSTTRATLQSQVNNYIDLNINNKANKETRSTTPLTVGGVAINYTNNAIPTSNIEVLNVNYYDDYAFADSHLPVIPTTIFGQAVTSKTKGLLTSVWAKTLGELTWAKSYTFYDKKGRVIYAYEKNHLGGFTHNKSELDFRGKIQKSETNHMRLNSSANVKIVDRFEYDHVERPKKHFQKINVQAEEFIAENTYNELGQLEHKKVGGGLQDIDYNYNVRGWLTNINDVNNIGADLFAYTIKYDEAIEGNASVGNVYNGNIKQVVWKSAINNVKKSYAYEYDKLGRFSESHFRENNSLTGGAGKFETFGMSYDPNGNIKTLKRNNQSAINMDVLNYNYDDGNRLLSINDTTNNTFGFNDGSSSDNEYDYDGNGNLTKDLNKNIASIEYNHFDLVKKVTFNNGNKIEFTYDSNGSKLKMKTTVGSSITTIDYLGGFQYTDTQLQFFPTPEGYVTKEGSNYNYVYILRDHLGNNRVSYSDNDNDNSINPDSEILSNTDFYVMGLTHNGEIINGTASNYNYKYQGKEQLSFDGYNMYDFGSRMYDPAVGRWFNVDPQNQFWSPYLAMGNNYIIVIDPDGEWAIIDDIIAIAVGGTINVISNWDNIDGDWGKGLSYFGIGAAAGEASLYGGPIAGAAVLSLGNSAYTQHSQTGKVDLGQTLSETITGTATQVIGGQIGGVVSKYTGNIFPKLTGLTAQYVNSAISNTVTGFGLTFGFGIAEGQNVGDAFSAGISGIPQSLAISTIGVTGSHLKNKRYANKQAKQEQIKNAFEADTQKKIDIKPIELSTSSKKTNPSVNYTIYNADGTVNKFGVSGASLKRYYESIDDAGLGAYGKYSKQVIPKYKAHIYEKYMRSLHFNSTGQYKLQGMKIPYPVNFNTLKPIKPTFKP